MYPYCIQDLNVVHTEYGLNVDLFFLSIILFKFFCSITELKTRQNGMIEAENT